MNLEKIRMESDSIGEMEVPADAYYGVSPFAQSRISRSQETSCIHFSFRTWQK